MVHGDDGPAPEARPPLLADLIALCRSLNREGARYVVIDGMAMIQAGFIRATQDIDLLVDASADNIEGVRRALLDLPDQAIREMAPGDLEAYVVVRVADEIVVDLLKSAVWSLLRRRRCHDRDCHAGRCADPFCQHGAPLADEADPARAGSARPAVRRSAPLRHRGAQRVKG